MGDTMKKQNVRIEKVAPEGEWGYLIAIGLAIPTGLAYGLYSSFGLLYNDFLTNIGAGTTAVTTIMGTFALCQSLASLCASSLIKTFSMRLVGVFGAILFSLGSFMTIFVSSVEHLVISFGIFQGAAFGFMFSVGYTNFNFYFVKKRIFMMSLTQLLKGVIASIYPIVVQFLVETYGFRGALALLTAIHFNTIIGMLLMHPVEWHLKEIEVPIEESKPLMNINDNEAEVKITMKSDDLNDGVVLKEKQNIRKYSFKHKLIDFFDLSLLKDWRYLNIAIGITLSIDSDAVFYTLIPMYLFNFGFTKNEAAAVIVTGSIGDIVSRVALAIISYNIQIKARHIYLAGVVPTLFLRIAFVYVFSFYGISSVIAMICFFRTWCYAVQTLVIAEYLPPERFASGYGLFLFINGIIRFIITPIFGWIRDVTQSYVICFNALTLLLPMCAVPWIVELLWYRVQYEKIPN